MQQEPITIPEEATKPATTIMSSLDEDDDLGDIELGAPACELGEACEACQ